MDAQKTGRLIAERRRELGLTQNTLAGELHISHTTVSKWERGMGFPDVALIEPLSRVLELSIAELYLGERAGDMPADCERALTDAVRVTKEQTRKKRMRYLLAALSVIVLVLALAILAILYVPAPVLRGSYQSDWTDGYIVQIAVQKDADGTFRFTESIDCRVVDTGVCTDYGDGIVRFESGRQDFTVVFLRDNSFVVTVSGIDGGAPIRLQKISDTPTYNPTDYGDEASYAGLLG